MSTLYHTTFHDQIYEENHFDPFYVSYFPGALLALFAGLNFSFSEKEKPGVDYMGNGLYWGWKNRFESPGYFSFSGK